MIFDKVDELSELLEETKQYTDYLDAEIELENDGYGMDLIVDFGEFQEQYVNMYNTGTRQEIEAMEIALEQKHAELLAHETTGVYIKSREAFEQLIEQITQRIFLNLGLFNPEQHSCEGCSSSDDCQGGC